MVVNSITPPQARNATRLGRLSADDLSPVAWVHGELRRSLETVNKTLRRYLREKETASYSDIDAVEPAVLRGARAQLHQCVGALEMVDLGAAAKVLRAAELLVQCMINKPSVGTPAAVEAVERVSFALLDWLARYLAGKSVPALLMYPQYETAMVLAAADRVHPADLWSMPWRWPVLRPEATNTPRLADDSTRSDMEAMTLALMREPGRASCLRMSNLCADLAAGTGQQADQPTSQPTGHQSDQQHLASLWQLASALYEALALDLVPQDLHTKRVASRLLAQLRTSSRGQVGLSERLAQDLLFFCAQAKPAAPQRPAPRLAAVQSAWGLDVALGIDYGRRRLGLHDPSQVAAARRRVAAAKDTWAAVAGDEQHRAANLMEQFTLVGDSLQRLFPAGDALPNALSLAAAKTAASSSAPQPALAMEVATAVLYVDAALEDGDFDQPDLPERMQRLAQRIDDVRAGATPQPLESWMEELYRRVSDRQTMGSVVHELRASLSEVEKRIDQYFRLPVETNPIMPVPAQLGAMRGVLSVLGLDQASQAVLHMRTDVEALLQTQADPNQAQTANTFNRLADNLGALSFLIDMLSVQPHLAKSLFKFDAPTGSLSAVMGQGERTALLPVPPAAHEPPVATPALGLTVMAGAVASMVPAAPPPSTPIALLVPDIELPDLVLADDDASPASASAPAPASSHPAVAEMTQGGDLHHRARALAQAAMQPNVSDDQLLAMLDALHHQADAADHNELMRVFALAQRGLRDSIDPATSHAVRADLVRATNELGQPVLVPTPQAATPPVPPPKPTPVGGTGLEDDTEMRDIFIEEAREVLAQADDAQVQVQVAADVTAEMTVMRRAFHTLKGSARMVGLLDFAEAAWSFEQLYNARLAHANPWDQPLQILTRDALRYLGQWVEAIAAGATIRHETQDVAQAADLLRLHGVLQRIALPGAADDERETPAMLGTLASRVSELPSAADLDLSLPLDEPEVSELLDLDLDLPEFAVSTDGPSLPITEAEPPDTRPFVFEQTLVLPGAPVSEPTPDAESPPGTVDFEFDLGDQTEAPAPMPAMADSPANAALPLAEAIEIEMAEGLFDLTPDDSAGARSEEAPGATPEAPFSLPPEAVDAEHAQAPDVDDEAPPADSATPSDASPPEPEVADPAERSEPGRPDAADEDENFKRIGPLRISIPLFNIFLNEADELSRRLVTELSEWALESADRPVPETCAVLAHGLAGSAGTVGCSDLSALARALEHALLRSHAFGSGRPGESELFCEVAEEIRRLLHQFAAGFLRDVPVSLRQRLTEHERLPVKAVVADFEPLTPDDETTAAAVPEVDERTWVRRGARPEALDVGDDLDSQDAVDADLFPIFREEAAELLPQLQARLRDWMHQPLEEAPPEACMRTLHTFKGGARLAGAMRLGEMAHRLETAIESLTASRSAQAADVLPLLARADNMVSALEALRLPVVEAAPAATPPDSAAARVPVLPDAEQPSSAMPPPAAACLDPAAIEPASGSQLAPAEAAESLAAKAPEEMAATAAMPQVTDIDWTALQDDPALAAMAPATDERGASAAPAVRVRAGLLDRLVNLAGEVTIARTRIDSDVKHLQMSMVELTASLDRMRRQLRDLELQAETQISSRLEAAKAAAQDFDPLEMDRFTRLQELTRFMAEAVNDVATLQRGLQRSLQSAEDQLAAQARLTRELQDDLLRTRMVEFESAADRLYRTVRQAAKEAGKQVRLDILGGAIELDRGVLERMVGPFEHLLRNCVVHGIESETQRVAAGKPGVGQVSIKVAQSGNEVEVDIHDDGTGLDLPRIRRRAVERGLLAANAEPSDSELSQLIYKPGFSTAQAVTELAGRGVGLDVVRAEVTAMGGRIVTQTQTGKGTHFKLLLPLTTAVTQVVMMRCGELVVGVPSTLIEGIRRIPKADIDSAYATGELVQDQESLPFFWLASLLQAGKQIDPQGRSQVVAVVRSAAQRVAVHVDEVMGNQEVVVKNVGPQMARVPGLAGVTLLPSGAVALIYNPVALVAVYGEQLRAGADPGGAAGLPPEPVAARKLAPLVMVVDDSLTVRRVTERLLLREGYRVMLAKDGLEALELLQSEHPVVVLTDIEMPRMDGFDLLRNIRAHDVLKDLPVVMITSRIAHKHREHASELGADHYLGKPYGDDELLSLLGRYAAGATRAGLAA